MLGKRSVANEICMESGKTAPWSQRVAATEPQLGRVVMQSGVYIGAWYAAGRKGLNIHARIRIDGSREAA